MCKIHTQTTQRHVGITRMMMASLFTTIFFKPSFSADLIYNPPMFASSLGSIIKHLPHCSVEV
ncbi:hypothetical protein BDZ94DRAFT_1265830 [Collybia nuda]|uniref:Uncharacterized protein n=1 Tax=Collybia nuda TaxID=64659 RepID=A0A9P5Y3D1_9AGAR|nr:hypothetical protein BDZ94DRAFT_1265830 [Collybia nuda]